MTFLLGILSSSNEFLLHTVYNTAVEQIRHSLDYEIVIIVNSLNPEYFNDVKNEFNSIDVEIIQTESNGKPGKGHNSVINLFKKRKQYTHLLLLDGDDFLYPTALFQIEQCFKKKSNLDMLVIKSTDKLKHFDDTNSDIFDINLDNNFLISSKLYIEHKLYPWNKEHIHLSNFYNDSLCTPFRLFLLSRNILKYIDYDLFHEQCALYDDYLTFLYFIKLSLNNNLNCYIIPGRYIYLYNSINVNSVTHNTDNNDIEFYKPLKSQFLDCYDFLGTEWNLTKLNTLYIDHIYPCDYKYGINESVYNLNLNVKLDHIFEDENSIFIKNFGKKIIHSLIHTYYQNCIKYFKNTQLDICIKYCKFFIQHNIKNAYISFIYIYCVYKLYNNKLTVEIIHNFKKAVPIAKCITDFYDIEQLQDYCDSVCAYKL